MCRKGKTAEGILVWEPRSLVSQPLESDISRLSLARDNANIPQWQLSAGH